MSQHTTYRPEPFHVLHHRVHETWGDSRLVFWVLNLRTLPDVTETHDVIARTLAEHGVTSYATYELLGTDFMVRCWVPRSTSCELLDEDLTRALRQLNTDVDSDYLEVHEIVRHWIFRKPGNAGGILAPTDDRLKDNPDSEFIGRLNASLTSRDPDQKKLTPDELSEAIDSRIIGPYLDLDSIFGGIKFVMWIKCHSASREQKRDVKALLARALDGLSPSSNSTGQPIVSELSLYYTPAATTADFVVMGRVTSENFYGGLRVLLDFVLSPYLRHVLRAKPQTNVLADVNFTRFCDGLAMSPIDVHAPLDSSDVRKLLDTIENSTLEFKGTAYVDLVRWLYSGDGFDRNEELFLDGIIRTVAAFLNTPPLGGQLVIGALEIPPIEKRIPLSATGEAVRARLDSFPRIGRFAIVGLNPDINSFAQTSGKSKPRINDSDSLALHILDRLQSALKRDVVTGRVEPKVISIENAELLVITVKPSGPKKWAYFRDQDGHERFAVRSGGRTLVLPNDEADEYKDQWHT